ncbi:MAG: D-aminoacylase [Acidobacteria bacterium]|nr:D-aminoacylase [Acidobacteriota bacterium]MDA1234557.1 D-aminoacylase [Acidobacteriota bacterium]
MKPRHVLASLVFALAQLSSCSSQPSYDLIIEHGSLVDGSGAPAREADVGILDGKIAAIGDLAAAGAERRIDASGLVVAPGFIDMHNHSDLTVIDEPNAESMVRQGVTTMILGEGGSQGPLTPGEHEWGTLGEYFDFMESKGLTPNIASYVGQTQIWTFIKGDELKPATDEEIALMQAEVEKAMQQGALGLSTSLLMPPSSLVTTEQLAELAKPAAAHGGLYSTHIRDEGQGVFDAIAEAIAVGRGAKIRVDIIHLKIADKALWGRMLEVLALIDSARAEGLDIRSNVYPYTAGQNNLRAIIPPWAHDGGNEAMLARLRDRSQRARLRRDILNGLPGWYNHYLATGGGWEGMLLVDFKQESNKQFVGKRMSELIASRVGDPVGILLDVLIEEDGSVPTVFFHHSEDDMQLAMKQPYTSIGSDGSAISPEGPRGATHPHPRWYGTFPRVLGRYVRELNTLELPEAVKKITSMNAEKANIPDRGLIKEGFWADATLFNPETVIDKATFEEPHHYPEGIPYVIVNGVVALDNGQHTNSRSGKVLRGPGYQPPAE